MKFNPKRPIYSTVEILSKILLKIKKKLDKIEKVKQNKKWEDLFQENNYTTYNLLPNVKINLYKDDYLSKKIYTGFEQDEINFINSNLNQGDIFIDIGANIGLFSIIAANKVGNSGKVIAFEPTKKVFNKLIENATLNNFENIDFRNIGLSNKKQTLSFYVSQDGFDAFNSFVENNDREEQKITIEASTLDIELENINKSLIKIVKIDVEGWEKYVLLGGQDFFTNYSPIVMMEFTEENTFNAGYSIHELYDMMQNYGYKWYRITNGELVEEKKQIHYPYVNLIAKK